MRQVVTALAAAAVVASCTPARMEAAEAAQVLERYAAGSAEAVDVCAPQGRDMLRSAVRSYGAVMAQSGQIWPELPGPDAAGADLNAVELSVLISFAAGFVQGSDLQPQARGRARRLALARLPDIMRFRGAARQACAQVVELQQAATRYMASMERYQLIIQQAQRNGGARAVERVRSQNRRVLTARAEMDAAARAVEARIGEPL